MKSWLKPAIALAAAIDLALLGILAVNLLRENARPIEVRHIDLVQKTDAADALSEQARRELYDRMTGEALAQTYVQGECRAKDGRINLRFSNGEASECAVRLELVSLDSGKTLAKTDLLDPGYHVESTEMLGTLPKGRYECLAKLEYYWMVNDAFVGTAARQVLLIVE